MDQVLQGSFVAGGGSAFIFDPIAYKAYSPVLQGSIITNGASNVTIENTLGGYPLLIGPAQSRIPPGYRKTFTLPPNTLSIDWKLPYGISGNLGSVPPNNIPASRNIRYTLNDPFPAGDGAPLFTNPIGLTANITALGIVRAPADQCIVGLGAVLTRASGSGLCHILVGYDRFSVGFGAFIATETYAWVQGGPAAVTLTISCAEALVFEDTNAVNSKFQVTYFVSALA